MEVSIQAKPGFVIKAYLIDINPFCQGLVRRVLIDERGCVFVPSYAWCSLDKHYAIYPLPNQVPHPERGSVYGNVSDGDWWESKAWKDELWAWCHLRRGKPDFHPCHVQEEPDGKQYIFAA